MCVIKSQYHQACTFRELFHNCGLDVSLGSISRDKSMSMLLTDCISIAFRRTIRGLRPLYGWLIDCLSPSTCRGPGCKRHVVLVTYQSLCIYSLLGSLHIQKTKMCGWYTDKHSHTHITHNPTAIYMYANTHVHARTHGNQKNLHLTCSFPAPKDRSGTAVTWEVMKLGGVRLSRLWESPV